MSTETLRLGIKVRSMRRREKLTQSDLAARLEISPSYLNLIEHQQRPLPAHLLVKLATIFKVDLNAFADDTPSRLAADLQEVFGDAIFEEHPVTTTDMRELADNTPLARAVLALYQAYHGSIESTRALSSKVYDGRDFLGVDPTHLPSEEVNDVIQNHLNYFPELEAAAEGFASAARVDRKDAFRTLARYLQEAHGIQVALAPASEPNVRRYDPERRMLTISEMLPSWSRSFHIAHQVGRIVAAPAIESVIANAQQNLTTPESLILMRVALANYFAAALLMPYDAFLAAAEETRYDIELLQHRFDVSFEQVCHRFTILPLRARRHRRQHLQALLRHRHPLRALLRLLSAMGRTRRLSHARADPHTGVRDAGRHRLLLRGPHGAQELRRLANTRHAHGRRHRLLDERRAEVGLLGWLRSRQHRRRGTDRHDLPPLRAPGLRAARLSAAALRADGR